MQFSVTALMLACTWVAVLIAAITVVLKMPDGLSDLPPLLVGLTSFASLAFAIIAIYADGSTMRSFWIGYSIAAVCFITFLTLHAPDGPNNQTTFRPFSDLLFEKLNATHSSWVSFHLANVLEYWCIPLAGSLGGMTATRLVLKHTLEITGPDNQPVHPSRGRCFD